MGGEELKWCQLAHHHIMNQQGAHLVHTVKLKPIIKAQISGKMLTNVMAWRTAEMDFQCLVGSTNVSEDLKYNVLCL